MKPSLEQADLRVRRTHKLLWEALMAELSARTLPTIGEQLPAPARRNPSLFGEPTRSWNSMRILYLSQYFFPEVGATQTRAYEMASNWVRLGHHVTMITELPNHPSGIILPAYRGKLVQ